MHVYAAALYEIAAMLQKLGELRSSNKPPLIHVTSAT